jgi:hypothetical protein
VVVEDRRAARERELGEARAGRRVLGVRVDPLPHRVELFEPGEEIGLLGARASERLEEVMVGVDEPGCDEIAAQVLVGLRRGRVAASHLHDEAVVDQQPAVRELRPRVVHRHDVGIREEGEHGETLSSVRAGR